MVVAHSDKPPPWRRRLYVPHYRVGEAARYAGISPQTVAVWHKAGVRKTLTSREDRESLSYMQLIEVAVVSAFRKAGLSLKSIRHTREYVSKEFQSEYPFAEYRFKVDGKRLVMDYGQVDRHGTGKLIRPDQGGQFVWEQILGRLKEFEYEHEDIVVKWRVSGAESPIIIDPRVAFGAPAVKGIPTWTIRGRWKAGETVEEIAEDFGLDEKFVYEALSFENIDTSVKTWKH